MIGFGSSATDLMASMGFIPHVTAECRASGVQMHHRSRMALPRYRAKQRRIL